MRGYVIQPQSSRIWLLKSSLGQRPCFGAIVRAAIHDRRLEVSRFLFDIASEKHQQCESRPRRQHVLRPQRARTPGDGRRGFAGGERKRRWVEIPTRVPPVSGCPPPSCQCLSHQGEATQVYRGLFNSNTCGSGKPRNKGFACGPETDLPCLFVEGRVRREFRSTRCSSSDQQPTTVLGSAPKARTSDRCSSSNQQQCGA